MIYRTTVETQLGVTFPGDQDFFGIIGKPGPYNRDDFRHNHDRSSVYSFPQGTTSAEAEDIWKRLVLEAQAAGKPLFSDEHKFNLSLVNVNADGREATLNTRRINYKEFKVASTPQMQNQINEGDLDPHLMLAQCQVISGLANGERVVLRTWRKPENNEYRGDQCHEVGGHHTESDGSIWNTFINEQRGEVNLPGEVIDTSRTTITGFGWDWGIQKPEILGLVKVNEEYDLSKNVGMGRGVRTFIVADDPRAITDHLLECFPHLVPPGVAAQYVYMIVNHSDIGIEHSQRLLKGIHDQTEMIREIPVPSFISEVIPLIAQRTNTIHNLVGQPSYESLPPEQQLKIVNTQIPYYLMLAKRPLIYG